MNKKNEKSKAKYKIEDTNEIVDLEYFHQRHNDSFLRSMNDWQNFDPNLVNPIEDTKLQKFVTDMCYEYIYTKKEFNELLIKLRKKYTCSPSKAQLIKTYKYLIENNIIKSHTNFEHFIIKKTVRTSSGVMVITILTGPGDFSCPKDCYYCPNEPGQPRSYLSTEPAVLRGNQNNWDAADQFFDRANTLMGIGHIVDKIEILVLGGTWSGYPRIYQETFIRDLFYAANVFGQETRERKTLEEEQTLNESAECKIIGLTLETRPDFINKYECLLLRRYGCTRVQIGIQHTDDAILKTINRGCYRKDAIKAIHLLKNCGFKVDIHIMPDLPTSSVTQDLKMFEYLITTNEMQADQWKIYPCEVTPFTVIAQWFKEGRYIPYGDNGRELIDLLIFVKQRVPPWIRLNRVIRDIPNQSIIAGNQSTNLRQQINNEMKEKGMMCRCMRCREVRVAITDVSNAVLLEREYPTVGGQEIFLSFESDDENTLYAFLRLRIVKPNGLKTPFPELIGCALIREVHVYGMLVGTGTNDQGKIDRPQHTGFGKRLIQRAEQIVYSRGLRKVAVISGIGARNYYKKFGYILENTYMIKKLTVSPKDMSVTKTVTPLIPCETFVKFGNKMTYTTKKVIGGPGGIDNKKNLE
eukprot:GHVL01036456.1.p1 GENE.GHVL01036456.1~~GHVL01036456.1.p1  ORF type:complete len:637 (-),score=145.70 GHVL01036456.1:2888-4798(-)